MATRKSGPSLQGPQAKRCRVGQCGFVLACRACQAKRCVVWGGAMANEEALVRRCRSKRHRRSWTFAWRAECSEDVQIRFVSGRISTRKELNSREMRVLALENASKLPCTRWYSVLWSSSKFFRDNSTRQMLSSPCFCWDTSRDTASAVSTCSSTRRVSCIWQVFWANSTALIDAGRWTSCCSIELMDSLIFSMFSVFLYWWRQKDKGVLCS